jgi:hypothetical protein
MLTIGGARLVPGKARGRRCTLRYSEDEQRSRGPADRRSDSMISVPRD